MARRTPRRRSFLPARSRAADQVDHVCRGRRPRRGASRSARRSSRTSRIIAASAVLGHARRRPPRAEEAPDQPVQHVGVLHREAVREARHLHRDLGREVVEQIGLLLRSATSAKASSTNFAICGSSLRTAPGVKNGAICERSCVCRGGSIVVDHRRHRLDLRQQLRRRWCPPRSSSSSRPSTRSRCPRSATGSRCPTSRRGSRAPPRAAARRPAADPRSPARRRTVVVRPWGLRALRVRCRGASRARRGCGRRAPRRRAASAASSARRPSGAIGPPGVMRSRKLRRDMPAAGPASALAARSRAAVDAGDSSQRSRRAKRPRLRLARATAAGRARRPRRARARNVAAALHRLVHALQREQHARRLAPLVDVHLRTSPCASACRRRPSAPRSSRCRSASRGSGSRARRAPSCPSRARSPRSTGTGRRAVVAVLGLGQRVSASARPAAWRPAT